MPTLPQDESYEAIYKKEHAPEQLVFISNKLAQATFYSLSIMQEKILATLIAHVKPKQHKLTVLFSTNQFLHMTAHTDSGTNFHDVMHAIQNLANKSFYLKEKDGKYHLKRWIWNVTADPKGAGNGSFSVEFNREMKGLIFFLSHTYNTIFPVSDILLMKSNYSIKLYYLFKSNASRNRRLGLNYSLNEIKQRLNLVQRRHNGDIWRNKNHQIKYKYPRFADFNRRVLQPAVKEINELTECNIKMKKIKTGRKITAVNVVMRPKTPTQRRKRDDRYYLTVKGIPKSKWGAYKRKIRYGTAKTKKQRQDAEARKIMNYGKKSKMVEGHYHTLPRPFQPRHEKDSHITKYYSPFDKKFEPMSDSKLRSQFHDYEIIKEVKNKYKK